MVKKNLLIFGTNDVSFEHLQRLFESDYNISRVQNETDFFACANVHAVVIIDADGDAYQPAISALRNIRDAGKNVAVLILSEMDRWNEKMAGFQAGADDFLNKPYHHEELQLRIAALARRA